VSAVALKDNDMYFVPWWSY